MNKPWLTPLLFILLVGTTACSKKSLVLDAKKGGTAVAVNEIDFNYFSGKAKINYKDEKYDVKAKANIRIKKDSVIWMTLSAVGIPGGRCIINQDSITILNILKKEYYVFDYPELSELFGFEVSFEAIQAVTLGNLIQLRDHSDQLEHAPDALVLRQQSGTVTIDNYINPSTLKIEKVSMQEYVSKNTADIQYMNFQPIGSNAFPYSGIISLFYVAKSGRLSTKIEFEFSRAQIEEKELRFPFNIPKKYERK